MTQAARPTSDVSQAGWNPLPVSSHINATVPPPPDDDYVRCPVPPGGRFEVQLAPLARPITGEHRLTVRLEQTESSVALVSFFLLQANAGGTQTIAGRSVVPTRDFTNYELVLTEPEIDLITDYANLRLRVLVSGPGGSYGSEGGLGSGLLSGSVSGLRSGSVSGPGSKSGSGLLSGSVSGSRSGLISGSRSGSVTGPRSGSISGSASGSISGSVSGSRSGYVSGSGSLASGSRSGSLGSGSGVSGSGPGSVSGSGSLGSGSGGSGSGSGGSGSETGSESGSGLSGSESGSGSGPSLWWCVQYGDGVPVCQQAATQPEHTISGPYATQAECEANCGRIQTACCDTPTPRTLYATFSGSLSAVGTVQLIYDDDLGYWTAPSVSTCSLGGIRFACTSTAPNDWGMVFSVGNCGGPETSCDPFLWSCTGTNFGPCAGTFTVTVTETSP